MKLKKIKLAGFKSFVDPTTIHFPSHLIGIVGPNGCGKSNVIDAVRWVMGESSAKHLRGDTMADVIFDGSTTRKPVGVASIELFFDNSDGSLGGQYASYADISIKRKVSRDGISGYYLNGARCRRRDITDVFLGTGLGPRSYSIIEQGMISRLIEAKPEELRIYLEEAAGISRYKERRRETENRIRHTKENLVRLNDLREEVARQLQHARRQARTAERFRDLRDQERRLHAEQLVLNAREHDLHLAASGQQVAEQQTALEQAVAELRRHETALEQGRVAQTGTGDRVSEIQGRFYAASGEVSRVEQAIEHHREIQQRQARESEQVEQSYREVAAHIDADRGRLAELDRELVDAEPRLAAATTQADQASERRQQAEQAMQAWQTAWETFNQEAAAPAQSAQVERTRTEQLEQRGLRLRTRRERLMAERAAIDLQPLEAEIGKLRQRSEGLHAELERGQAEHAALREQLQAQRAQAAAQRQTLDTTRDTLQRARGRQSSLEALQQAALGHGDDGVVTWLKRGGLADAPRLIQGLEVEPGWEQALETVLGPSLEAVCVTDSGDLAASAATLETGHLFLVDMNANAAVPNGGGNPLIASRVIGSDPARRMLAGIYAAEDLDEALARRAGLADHESIVTRDGIWLGRGWVRVARERDARSGMLQRGQELRDLEVQIETLQRALDEGEAQEKALRVAREALEQQLDAAHRQQVEAHSCYTDLRGELGSREARLEQLGGRQVAVAAEIEEIEGEERARGDELGVSRQALHKALGEMDGLAARRETLEAERARLREAVEAGRTAASGDRTAAHELALRSEALRTARQSAAESLERMLVQSERLGARRAEVATALAQAGTPHEALQRELEVLLEQRLAVEAELGAARRELGEIEAAIRLADEARVRAEHTAEERRGRLEQVRMHGHELGVRLETVREQIAETGFDEAELLAELPADAEPEAWLARVEAIAAKVQRLGPINLAAIEEARELEERMGYLDSQYNDITEALDTLETAIGKIDRETRTRFRETFDKVNNRIGTLFPRLFGGGHAYLQLVGDDLLDTGVTVMARPPGKRNSSIHLLSGGEKALTAVALVFSIFHLNPAPFCMLDEVDAPLDDANVIRFCNLVREMSSQVQFIFITHNKVTMELADQLLGVTMNEPGVSRMVSVDVGEALRIATG